MDENTSLEKLYEKQLEIVQNIYAKIEEKSSKVLEKADENSDKVLEKVDSILNRVEKTEKRLSDQVEDAKRKAKEIVQGELKRWKTIAVVSASIVIPILSLLGIKTYGDIMTEVKTSVKEINDTNDSMKTLYQEIATKAVASRNFNEQTKNNAIKSQNNYEEINKIQQELKKNLYEADALIQIMLHIRRIAQDAKLGEEINMDDIGELQRTCTRFNQTLREVFEYIKTPTSRDYRVVNEAIDVYLNLVKQGQAILSYEDINKLIIATIEVLKNCPDTDWRTQLKSRDILVKLSKNVKKSDEHNFDKLIKYLHYESFKENFSVYKWNLVVAISRIGKTENHEIEFLRDSLVNIDNFDISEKQKMWMKCVSSIALIKLEKKEKSGWQYISQKWKNRDSYEQLIIIQLLSELGRKKLEHYNIEQNWEIGLISNKIDFLISEVNNQRNNAKDIYNRTYFTLLNEVLETRQ
jgi:hypothetical protein